jgi:nucleotide-binding universal stress UspA family protein
VSATIVMVPLDGSPAAEAALPWATHLAKKFNAGVRLVGVHTPPAMILDGEALAGSVVPDTSVRQQEIDYFAGVQARLQSPGVPVAADLLDGGVVSALAEYAANLRPAWIVMLSHARGAVARFLLGETATEFVRHSPCPVLLVHETGGPAPADVRHVLVPLDGSPLAERMTGPAVGFAKALGAEVTLLTALAEGHREDAEAHLAAQAKRAQAAGVPATTRVVGEGPAADVIVAAAEARPGTVVAMATHGRGGLSKLVWGSVTDRVIRRAASPVLVFRPEK